MSGLESALLAVGRAVVIRAVAVWQGDRRARWERSSDLIELLAPAPDLRLRRRTARAFEEVTDEVVNRLEAAFGPDRLPEHEKLAALAEVEAALTDADLSDEALFAIDADPILLARRLRRDSAARIRTAGLSEVAMAFYHRVLDDSAGCLVALVLQLPAFDARATAETLARLSGLSARMSEVLDRLPRTSLEAPAGVGLDADFERRYLVLVGEELDRLELFGVPTHSNQPRQRLTVAYLSLTVSEDGEPYRQGGRHRDLLRGQPFFGRSDRDGEPTQVGGVRVEAALGRADRTFLRGEAGSGKTTLLHWLAVTAARRRFTGDLSGWNRCVPFLVTLRRYAGEDLPRPEQLLDREQAVGAIAGQMPPGWAHRMLDSGRALLLVDGVDELADRQRPRVRDWLARLVRVFPRVKMVVTSRPLNTTAKWLETEGFAPVTLDRMNPPDVKTFVDRWHEAADGGSLPCRPEELPGYRTGLLRQLDANPHLRAMATNPLLCALICALNLDRRAHVPRDRMSLYAAALELLLERRDVEREVPADREFPLDFRQKVEVLTGLAWWLTENGRVDLHKDDAVRELGFRLRTLPELGTTPKAVLRYLTERSGVVREPVMDRIDFVHRTFQDYLAAREAADHGNIDLLVDRAHLDPWWETVVLAAGHGSPAFRADLLTGLLGRAGRAGRAGRHARRMKLLAAACLETVPSIPEHIRDRVESTLDTLIPPRNRREARTLATAGEPVLRRLPDDLAGLTARSAAAAVRSAALIHSPRTLDVLARYALDPRSEVQQELAAVWEYFDLDEYARRILADAPLDSGGIQITDRRMVPALRHLRNLTALYIDSRGKPVTDLDWLANAPALTGLEFIPSGAVDLSPLRAHPGLEQLWMSEGDLPDNLDLLLRLPRLWKLDLSPATPVTNLDFLVGLTELKWLGLGDLFEVCDFAPMGTLHGLTDFMVNGGVLPAPALLPLTRLTSLMLFGTVVDGGLAALAEVRPELTDLTLFDFDQADDLSPLARLTHLRDLDLSYCLRLGTLEPLRDLPNLQTLDLSNARPGLDLSPLAGKRLHLWLAKDQQVIGLDMLGPSVRVRRFR